MSKESWKNVKEVAAVTAVGAAEGAAIGFAIGTVFLGLPGYAAGGIIGGTTALLAELNGRMFANDVTVTYTAEGQSKDGKAVRVRTTDTIANVPQIQTADKVLTLLPNFLIQAEQIESFRKFSFDLKKVSTWKDGSTITSTRSIVVKEPNKR